MNEITDDEFSRLYDMAEEAERQGCFGASMKLETFKKIRNLYNYQLAYIFGLRLRQLEVENRTIFLSYRKLGVGGAVITWSLVPYGFVAKIGRSGWRNKEWLEFDELGASKKIIY